jgi:hypothetical protein
MRRLTQVDRHSCFLAVGIIDNVAECIDVGRILEFILRPEIRVCRFSTGRAAATRHLRLSLCCSGCRGRSFRLGRLCWIVSIDPTTLVLSPRGDVQDAVGMILLAVCARLAHQDDIAPDFSSVAASAGDGGAPFLLRLAIDRCRHLEALID